MAWISQDDVTIGILNVADWHVLFTAKRHIKSDLGGAAGVALAELQPTARLVVVPGAGHDVHQENAGAVLEVIRLWMTPAS